MVLRTNTRKAAALAGAMLAALVSCGERQEPALAGGYHDFGMVPHGERPTHTFVICRSAGRAFKVRGVVAQCSCARTRLTAVGKGGERRDGPLAPKPGSELTVAAGEGLELEIQFDTSLKHAIDSGPLPFDTVVTTDLADQPELLFRCDAQIRARMGITPSPLIDLGPVADRQAASATLELAPRDGRTFQILEVAGAGDGITVEKVEGSPGVHIYRIDSPPGRPFDGDGGFLRFLQFKTDLDGGYTLPVQVRAQRLPAVRVEPAAKISFGQIDMTKPATGFVTVRRSTGGPLELTLREVQLQVGGTTMSADGKFEVAFEPLGEKRAVRTELRYTGKLAAREFRGTLVLGTNEPDRPTVEIEFVGFARM